MSYPLPSIINGLQWLSAADYDTTTTHGSPSLLAIAYQ
jgi:hypothetical protein